MTGFFTCIILFTGLAVLPLSSVQSQSSDTTTSPIRVEGHTMPSPTDTLALDSGMSLALKGVELEKEGKFEEALESYRNALAIHRQTGTKRLIAEDLLRIGELLEKMFDYTGALPYALEAVRISDDNANLHLRAVLQKASILSYDTSGNRVLQLLDSTRLSLRKNRPEVLRIYEIYATSYGNRGEYRQAMVYQDSLRLAEDSLRAKEFRSKFNVLQSRNTAIQTRLDSITYFLSLERQEAAINQKNTSLIIWMIVLLGIVLLTILAFIMITQRVRYRKERLIMDSMALVHMEEQQRVARDLSNGVGIKLATLKNQLSDLRQNGIQEAEPCVTLLTLTENEVKRISRFVMPEAIRQSGLALAIQQMVESLNSRSSHTIHFTHTGVEVIREERRQFHIYRIVQELLIHSGTDPATGEKSLVLRGDKKKLVIMYSEKGAETESLEAKNEGGEWKNIRVRTNYLNGTCKIERKPEKGLNVVLEIPVAES